MNNLTKSNRDVKSYDPWRDFFNLESFFPADFSRPLSRALPAVNISEDEKGFNIDVIAPGFKKEDFKINVNDDTLTISAEAKSETTEGDKKQYNRREYSYSSFTRSFRLPDNAKDDSIGATYADGVLKLTVPKSEQQVKATKQIAVK